MRSRATRKRNACFCVVVYDSERALYLKFGESDTGFHTSCCCLFGVEHDYAAALVQQSTFCKSSADRKDTHNITDSSLYFCFRLCFPFSLLFPLYPLQLAHPLSACCFLLHVFIRVSSSFCKPDTIIINATTFAR